MTTPHTNPFVLPGMGQTGDAAGNPLLASMEMMRNAWSGLTGPGGLAQSLPMSPPMNLDDLERRIGELRSIESWLRMNLSMLSSTIQGMEVQRSTIATLRSFVSSVSSMEGFGSSEGVASPLEIVLGLKPNPRTAAGKPKDDANVSPSSARPGAGAGHPGAGQSGAGHPDAGHFGAGPTAAESPSSNPAFVNPFAGAPFAGNPFAGNAFAGGAAKAAATPSEKKDADSASPADPATHMAQAASQAWWDMLQQQFNQIATATTASMPAAAAAVAPTAVAPGTAPNAVPTGAKAGKSGFNPDLPTSAPTSAASAHAKASAPAPATPKRRVSAARAPAKSAGRATPDVASEAASGTASKAASKTASAAASKIASTATDKAPSKVKAPGKVKVPLPRKSKS
jgi:hypothetical protein